MKILRDKVLVPADTHRRLRTGSPHPASSDRDDLAPGTIGETEHAEAPALRQV